MTLNNVPKEKVLAVFVLCLAVVAGGGGFLVKFQLDKLGRLRQQAAKEGQVLAEAQRLVAQIPDLERSIAGAEEKIVYYEAKLPGKDEVAALFKELDEKAQEARVQYMTISEASEEMGEHYTKFTRKIVLTGGYHEVGRFINKLEALDRLVRVDDISMESDPSQPFQHNVVLVVSTYVAKAEEVAN